MTRWQLTLEVARWEFARFVKWKQQFMAFLILIALGLAGSVIGKAVKRAESKPVTVAAIDAAKLGFALPAAPPVVWDTTIGSEAEARRALEAGRIGGALLVRSATRAEILLRKRAEWTGTVEQALTTERQRNALSRLAATSPEGAALLIPLEVHTAMLASGTGDTRSARIAALLILLLGFSLVMSGFGTLFTGITGEKQHRVTEQLVAMVPPQVWMDGKILGLTGAGIAGAAISLGGMTAVYLLLPAILGRDLFALPPVATDAGLLAQIGVITLLGVLLWYAFMAAIASTIDDPNSSTRTLLLFVPVLPMGLAFSLTTKLDSALAQAFALFPLTSSAVLPMRLAVTTVPWWEVPLAVLLLIAAVWLFRRLAGKVFGTAVLMYGKEPTLREMWRWAREA